MKKLFAITVICSFLFACNNPSSNNSQDTSTPVNHIEITRDLATEEQKKGVF